MFRVATAAFGIAVAVTALGAVSAAPLGAQVRIIDEGSFTLYRDGDRIGREDFSIREAPGAEGRVFVAQATVAIGPRRITPGLNADTSGYPSRYQREVRDSDAVTETYSGVGARGRFSSRLVTHDGESARELRLPPGTVAADDDIIHQLWFITRRPAGTTVPVLVPRRNTVEVVRVERVGAESVTIDLRQFETTHLAIRTASTGIVRDVWVDAGGRIIKASIPALGLVALRD
ncbi:MAG TPA: hypothetical protein VG916_09450 [Gemmatimonadaceae bacterium]|nr:hypothetical protein [Gemmatimonadaceae bacterium]